MGSDDTAGAQGVVQELEVGLLEQGLGGAVGVRRVGDDHVEGVLVLVEELEAVADVHLDLGVVEALGHAGEVLLGEADDGLVFVKSRELFVISSSYLFLIWIDAQIGRQTR